MEDNMLIAKFMGAKSGKYGLYWFPDGNNFSNPNRCEYTSSWNWLMPVVEKIEKIEDVLYIDVSTTHTHIELSSDEIEIYGDNRLDSTYKAVTEFIKWYKEDSNVDS